MPQCVGLITPGTDADYSLIPLHYTGKSAVCQPEKGTKERRKHVVFRRSCMDEGEKGESALLAEVGQTKAGRRLALALFVQ